MSSPFDAVDISDNSKMLDDYKGPDIQDGGSREKNVKGPDGNTYYGIVAPSHLTVNGVKTKNKTARAAVMRGDYYRTRGGLTKNDLCYNKQGKIVSCKKQKHMKKSATWKKYFGKRRAKTFKRGKSNPKYKKKSKSKSKTKKTNK